MREEHVKYRALIAYEGVNYETKENCMKELTTCGDIINNNGIFKEQQNKIIEMLLADPFLYQRTIAKRNPANDTLTLKICKDITECKTIYKSGAHGGWNDYYYVYGIVKETIVTTYDVISKNDDILKL